MTDLIIFYSPQLILSLVVLLAALFVEQSIKLLIMAVKDRRELMGRKYDGQW